MSTNRNWWQEKPEFWKNKLKNPVYKAQGQEALKDLMQMVMDENCQSFLDVGGYNGRINEGGELPDYLVADSYYGFDITSDWSQIVRKFDVSFTSLTLICFPPHEVQKIFDQMLRHTRRYVYLFEEKLRPGFGDGDQVSEEYGGKWTHDFAKLAEKQKLDYTIAPSSTSPENWIKIRVKVP